MKIPRLLKIIIINDKIKNNNNNNPTRPCDNQQNKENLPNSGLCSSSRPQDKTEGKRKER